MSNALRIAFSVTLAIVPLCTKAADEHIVYVCEDRDSKRFWTDDKGLPEVRNAQCRVAILDTPTATRGAGMSVRLLGNAVFKCIDSNGAATYSKPAILQIDNESCTLISRETHSH